MLDSKRAAGWWEAAAGCVEVLLSIRALARSAVLDIRATTVVMATAAAAAATVLATVNIPLPDTGSKIEREWRRGARWAWWCASRPRARTLLSRDSCIDLQGAMVTVLLTGGELGTSCPRARPFRYTRRPLTPILLTRVTYSIPHGHA